MAKIKSIKKSKLSLKEKLAHDYLKSLIASHGINTIIRIGQDKNILDCNSELVLCFELADKFLELCAPKFVSYIVKPSEKKND